MVEILGAVWLTALILSLPVTFLNIRSVWRSAQSPRLQVLNGNLEKIGMAWSLSSESFRPLEEVSLEEDSRKMIRSYLLMGALGFFGAVGFMFLLVVSLSMRLLVSRTAKLVFDSALTQRADLEASTVRAIVEEISASR